MRILTGHISTSAALLLAAVVALPAGASAQSLGEAAERAKKERKGTKTKVITETDLRRAGGGVEAPVSSSEEAVPAQAAPAPAAEGAPEAATPAKPEKTEDELRAEAQATWREHMQKTQADVTRLNAEADQLQMSLNDLSQNLYGSKRTATMNRLDEVKKQLATAQQAVVDLEEQGRRSRFRQ